MKFIQFMDWMHGNVINKELGEGGFGYDLCLFQNGFDKLWES